ncbi:unnamed protein product, partial [Gulo gulo]
RLPGGLRRGGGHCRPAERTPEPAGWGASSLGVRIGPVGGRRERCQTTSSFLGRHCGGFWTRGCGRRKSQVECGHTQTTPDGFDFHLLKRESRDFAPPQGHTNP